MTHIFILLMFSLFLKRKSFNAGELFYKLFYAERRAWWIWEDKINSKQFNGLALSDFLYDFL